VALLFAPLTWLESLKPNSIDSWEDLKRAFINNFKGSMIRVGPRHDLSQVKQEMNETLRSYVCCFFETPATIANITNEDVICCFQNGLFLKHMYHDFGRNYPTTAVELCDMMGCVAEPLELFWLKRTSHCLGRRQKLSTLQTEQLIGLSGHHPIQPRLHRIDVGLLRMKTSPALQQLATFTPQDN
jgi:hypothetical protein